MNEIDDYNADARRLRTALDAQGESDYVWGVHGWGIETEFEISRKAKKQGTTEEEERANALKEIMVRANTKRSYDKGRLRIFTYLNRDLLRSDLAMSLAVLTHSAGLEVELMLQEARDEPA